MQSFFERLEARVRSANTLVCIGLDPRAATAQEAREQCLRVIEATHEYAAVFKANSAFYEVFGAAGMDVLCEVLAAVPREVPVILDAKRGDIADTSIAYARAAFDTFKASAITVSPYVGRDGLAPFLERADRGAFVLCKTSNPGADEFQVLETNEGDLFETVARHVARWNTLNNVGLVVGATDPARMARVRAAVSDLWILVPGVGTQGGALEATVRAGIRADGMGLVVNASRSIATAANPSEAAKRLRDEINEIRISHTEKREARNGKIISGDDAALQQLADDLYSSPCVRFGEFTLKSGQKSPIYLDLRRLVSHPEILKRVGKAYANILRGLEFDRMAGIPYAALPIATAASLEMGRPMIYPRREVKDYGTKAVIEGDYVAGETVVVLDDLTTTGETKFEAIEKLTGAGLKVRDIVVLIDREQGAKELLANAGLTLYAVTTLPQLLELWRRSGVVTQEQVDAVNAFLGR